MKKCGNEVCRSHIVNHKNDVGIKKFKNYCTLYNNISPCKEFIETDDKNYDFVEFTKSKKRVDINREYATKYSLLTKFKIVRELIEGKRQEDIVNKYSISTHTLKRYKEYVFEKAGLEFKTIPNIRKYHPEYLERINQCINNHRDLIDE